MVTHAPDEVERLADRVVFMRDGRITSLEPLREALTRPDSPLFADEGAVCVLTGDVLPDHGDGFTRFGNEHFQFLIQGESAPQGMPTRLRIHANDVAIARHPVEDISVMNQLPITIKRILPFRSGRVLVTGRLPDGQALAAEITEHSCRKLGLEVGGRVHALIKSVALLE